MSTRTHSRPRSVRVHDHLRRMAAADSRAMLRHADVTLEALASHPGVPCKSELSKQLNGNPANVFHRGYSLIGAMAAEGVPIEVAMRIPAGFDNAVAVAYADRDELPLGERIHVAQEADLAEDAAEARVHAEKLSDSSLASWEESKVTAMIHDRLCLAAIRRERLRRRR